MNQLVSEVPDGSLTGLVLSPELLQIDSSFQVWLGSVFFFERYEIDKAYSKNS